MAKTDPDPKARAAGSNVGNEPPGSDDKGQNARRREAQAGGESVPTVDDSGLSPEQAAMEADREEYGSQERGSGDKPPIVHGRTRPVFSAHDSVPRLTPVPEGDPVTDPETVPKTRTVRALKLGYYDDKRRRPGDVFMIRAPYEAKNVDPEITDENDVMLDTVNVDEFSDKWMELVPDGTPLRVTTGKQALRAQHDAELAARRHGPASAREGATGNANPLGE